MSYAYSPEQHVRARRGGASSQDSAEVFLSAVLPTLALRQQEVLRALQEYPAGATAKEVSQRMGRPFNTISGRFTELLAAGLIYKTGERRDGCAVVSVRREAQATLF